MIELITNKESGVGIKYPGFKGDTGGYYIPNVDAEGTLTWQASEEGMPEAEAANIKGDKGETGDAGVYVGTEEPTDDSALVWINPEGGETEALATKKYVDEQIAAIEIPDVSGFITEIPAEYITETELNSKGYLTEHQSLDGYAKTTDIPDVSAYQTEAQVKSLIDSALVEVENGSY